MSIGINDEGNKIISNIRFLGLSFTSKNCEFINCEFTYVESCKFINCKFDKHCNYARGGAVGKGCEFVQCPFDNILISKLIY